ncbi:MAG: flagellar motor switch protein FliN [Phycisphaerales bacterium]|nr:flagellar motor switch protein FliN [Phycisphaerales bacterium]
MADTPLDPKDQELTDTPDTDETAEAAPRANEAVEAADAGGVEIDAEELEAALREMEAAGEASTASGAAATAGGEVATKPFQPQSFDPPEAPDEQFGRLGLLDDVELDVRIELGRTDMYIEDVLRLGEGSVVQLDKNAGDPVDIYVNDRLVARGEVLVLNENFCVRINDILSPMPEVEAES